MLEFLQTYWKIIAVGVLSLLDIILIILNRRKPVKVYDSVHQAILYILPSLIKSAEQSYSAAGQGENKLSMVLELVRNYLASMYGMSLEDAAGYDEFVKKCVEDILSTPTKKGE